MINRNPKQDQFQYFPLEELQKIVLNDKFSSKRINTKKLLAPKNVFKSHSKSLYYQNTQPNKPKQNGISVLNSTGVAVQNQTLNEQLLGIERPKPHTSDYKSGRLPYADPLASQLKSNKISLRSSSNYNRLSSVAGVSINQEQAQYRMESYMHSKNHTRQQKHKQIEKENKKIAERLNSQQSQYSTKKLQKEYESQERISKRLTQSKMSKRSSRSIDNRSICSDHSSRASVRSGASRNSHTSSMKSTSRLNSSDSTSRKPNRFVAKFQPTKKIKIVQHNINKMNNNELNKFKNLFANSFTTKHTYHTQNTNQLINPKTLSNNPYVDIEILSQKSETSIQKPKSSQNQKDSFLYSINNSNRKLRELNMEQLKVNVPKQQHQNETMIKKSSVITADGLLHRIVEEMYHNDKKGSTDNLVYRGKNKKASHSTNKTTNPEVRVDKLSGAGSRNTHNRKMIIRKEDAKNALLPAGNHIFSNKF